MATRFCPDNSIPETHTVIVPKKQIKEMRGEKKYVNQRICPEPGI